MSAYMKGMRSNTSKQDLEKNFIPLAFNQINTFLLNHIDHVKSEMLQWPCELKSI